MGRGVAGEAGGQAAGDDPEPLGGEFDQVRHPGERPAGGLHPAPAILDGAPAAAVHPCAQVADRGLELGQHRRRHLRGRRRGRRPAVGNEVDEGGVGLVAHGADQRDRAGRDRAGQGLVVERPEVLHRAAAARHDQHVGAGDRAARLQGLEAADGRCDLSRGGVALHHHRPDDDPAGPAVADAVQDVADHRAGRAGDHSDHRRHRGQGLFPFGCEQALGGEPGLQPFELGQERADAGRLHGLDDDLVAGARRIGGDLAGDDHLQPLLGPDA